MIVMLLMFTVIPYQTNKVLELIAQGTDEPSKGPSLEDKADDTWTFIDVLCIPALLGGPPFLSAGPHCSWTFRLVLKPLLTPAVVQGTSI